MKHAALRTDRAEAESPAPHWLRAALDRLGPGRWDTVYGIGAGFGHALGALTALPAKRIVLVEPNPEARPALDRLAAADDRIRVVTTAIGTASGTRPLYVFNDPDLSSLLAAEGLAQLFPGLAVAAMPDVPVIPFAALVAEQSAGETGPDLVVIDAPGAEKPVIAALLEDPGCARVRDVILRSPAEILYKGASRHRALLDRLAAAGFLPIDMDAASDPDYPVSILRAFPHRAELARLKAALAETSAARDRLAAALDRMDGAAASQAADATAGRVATLAADLIALRARLSELHDRARLAADRAARARAETAGLARRIDLIATVLAAAEGGATATAAPHGTEAPDGTASDGRVQAARAGLAAADWAALARLDPSRAEHGSADPHWAEIALARAEGLLATADPAGADAVIRDLIAGGVPAATIMRALLAGSEAALARLALLDEDRATAEALTRRSLSRHPALPRDDEAAARRLDNEARALAYGRDRTLFIDCGGFDGCSAILFLLSDPDADCVSFEPNPALWHHYDGLPTLLIPKAVLDRDGQVALTVDPVDGDGSSVMPGKTIDFRGKRANADCPVIDVPCIDLSAYVARKAQEYGRIVLKLDVEGAEYPILEKMLADGSLHLVDRLHVEFHGDRMDLEPGRHDRLVAAVAAVRPPEPWDAIPLRISGQGTEPARRRRLLLDAIAARRAGPRRVGP